MSQRLSEGKSDSMAMGAKRLFDRKLLAYAAATGAAVVSGQAAQATVNTRQINVDVPFPNTYALDVDGNGSTDFNFRSGFLPDGFFADVQGTGNNTVAGQFNAGSDTSFKAARLTTSNHLPGTQNWNNIADLGTYKFGGPGGGSTFGNWLGESGYLGIQFEGSDSLMHYGFVQMSLDNSFDMHIDAVAWQTNPTTDSDGGIHIEPIAAPAPVPEPVGLGALALGAAGLATLRRRRSV